MKIVAAAATVGAHATVLAVLGALGVEAPTQDRPPELTTVTLVDLPPLTQAEPEPEPEPKPEPEPEPEPGPEPPSREPEVEPPPRRPKPASPTRPDVAADAPTDGGADVEVPADAPPSAAPAGQGDPSPEPPARPARRKLSGELTNASPKGSKRAPAGCNEAPVRPKILTRVNPRFPAAARAGGVHGELGLIAYVTATGSVSRVEVASGLDPSVDEPAKAALLQWTFEPATRCGKAVSSKVRRGWRFAPKD